MQNLSGLTRVIAGVDNVSDERPLSLRPGFDTTSLHDLFIATFGVYLESGMAETASDMVRRVPAQHAETIVRAAATRFLDNYSRVANAILDPVMGGYDSPSTSVLTQSVDQVKAAVAVAVKLAVRSVAQPQ